MVYNRGDSTQLHCACFLRIFYCYYYYFLLLSLFCVIRARCARSELGSFSMKTELFGEINGRFLLNEYGEPIF